MLKFKPFAKFFTLISIAYTFTFAQCSKECTAALADLIMQGVALANPATTVFTAGSLVNLVSNIANLIDSNVCETQTAPSNPQGVELMYRATGSSTYVPAGSAKFATGAMNAGSGVNTNFRLTPTRGGDYFVTDKSDVDNIVPERNENNNGGDGANHVVRAKSNPTIVHFTVKPNPEIEKRIANGEHIPAVIFEDNPNLISSTVYVINADKWVTTQKK